MYNSSIIIATHMSYNYFPCVKGRSINNTRKYLSIFSATLITVCCLCSYICTVVLEAGNRVCLISMTQKYCGNSCSNYKCELYSIFNCPMQRLGRAIENNHRKEKNGIRTSNKWFKFVTPYRNHKYLTMRYLELFTLTKIRDLCHDILKYIEDYLNNQ